MAEPRQPDRSRGVFETLLVVDGAPVALEAHLGRLAQSLRAVYGLELPDQTESRLRQAAEGIPLGRVRLSAAPADPGLRLDLLAGEVEAEAVFPKRSVELRTRSLRGGLGPHKWVHREGIDHPAPQAPGVLIADGEEILEAGWANVFAARKGTLFTPPLDGRILPGVTRAAVIERARALGIPVVERPIAREEIGRADEVLLTNSIRGIEGVAAVDGATILGGGGIAERLASALRDGWRRTTDDGAVIRA